MIDIENRNKKTRERMRRYRERQKSVTKSVTKIVQQSQKVIGKSVTKSVTVTHPIPSALNTPAFQAAWAAFIESRKQIRKPITAIAMERQFAKFIKYDVAVVVAALEKSVENGWQGVFPESIKAEPKEWDPDDAAEELYAKMCGDRDGKSEV